MKLKELRKIKGYTQNEVASLLNIQTMTYNGYENNKREPNIEMLCKLAKLYNTSIDYLVGQETNQVNLEAIKPVKKKLIQYILKMNELQEIKAEAYLDGLMGE
ncbi:MAG: helix-turn-helix transcriptional regulator [Clostridia bacterium]|nr:helix-turn-helix transcriptional regulator [Clostridia bacterium]